MMPVIGFCSVFMSTSNVFGVIVTGRLIQTNFIQAAETEFITELEHANTINHVVVFLTGVSPFPDHLGGSVYIRWQKMGSSGNEITGWRYLGFISNAKPSAIFRIGQV
ncbi:protein OPI10 like protein [Ditylenchus destructor]|uniref:Protein OPI10 like protein n=1 Tax=Ditylenchus destructor TaxID=166010 RepID=A0AAD4N416_9BILA|nr:protein OPI10 like protein [Ditylenchus destructor]